MDLPTLLIGAFAICFGIYTAVVRIFWPQKFGKLEAMKKRYGNKVGTVVHVIGYTLAPIGFGLVMLHTAYRGGSIFAG